MATVDVGTNNQVTVTVPHLGELVNYVFSLLVVVERRIDYCGPIIYLALNLTQFDS